MMTTAKETASKASEKVTQTAGDVKETARPVVGIAHSALLAGLGALALGKEEISGAIDHLVEKGEVVEQDGRKTLSDLLERRKEHVSKAEEKFEGIIDERVEAILNSMNIPSKNDIDELSKKISSLSRKVNALDKKLKAEEKQAA